MKRALKSTLVIVLALLMASCNLSPIVKVLSIVEIAAEVALPIIEAATGLDATLASQILAYLKAASQATSEASTEIASNDPQIQKSLKITAAFTGVIAPNLPPNTPPAVRAACMAVNAAIQAVIQQFKPPAAGVVAVRTEGQLSAAKLTGSDKRALNSLSKAAKDHVALIASKHK